MIIIQNFDQQFLTKFRKTLNTLRKNYCIYSISFSNSMTQTVAIMTLKLKTIQGRHELMIRLNSNITLLGFKLSLNVDVIIVQF